ncbi:MAG: LacI family DNA-binding transcriptional regulator [Lactobacillaceae bacterium]|jgi:LacI family kdg operon repressor|nr:LacI family DNA-binding transcriptional regulator [Lactobacillaceae bacterium]
MTQPKKFTIDDIAQMAGVSKATISYYLNNRFDKMSEKTKTKIAQVIKENNYQPSVAATALARNESKIIGVVVNDITNSFIAEIWKGVQSVAKEKNYSVEFLDSGDSIDQEIENIHYLSSHESAGLILNPVDANAPHLKDLSNRNTVMFDRQSKDMLFDEVVSNNFEITKQFVGLMKNNGYDEIYFVTFPIENISTRVDRYKGFKDALQLSNDDFVLDVSNADIFDEKLQTIFNERGNKKIGFFAMNGPSLLVLLNRLQYMGKHHPTDYGVGSYEDLDWMKLLNPGISVIRQYSFEIGQKAAERLFEKIQDNDYDEPKKITVNSSILIRQSF